MNTIQAALSIQKLLGAASVTFAQIDYTTPVKTAAAHRDRFIQKHVNANVQLFANINAATSVFKNAVERSAGVKDFQVSDNYFEHSPSCYSLVQHKTQGTMYLYCIFNKVRSTAYVVDGKPATLQEVAQYLTPAAARDLLEPPKMVYNVTNDVEHDVIVRTIKLDNIHSIRAMGSQLVL
jgi:hypothetical protein